MTPPVADRDLAALLQALSDHLTEVDPVEAQAAIWWIIHQYGHNAPSSVTISDHYDAAVTDFSPSPANLRQRLVNSCFSKLAQALTSGHWYAVHLDTSSEEKSHRRRTDVILTVTPLDGGQIRLDQKAKPQE